MDEEMHPSLDPMKVAKREPPAVRGTEQAPCLGFLDGYVECVCTVADPNVVQVRKMIENMVVVEYNAAQAM